MKRRMRSVLKSMLNRALMMVDCMLGTAAPDDELGRSDPRVRDPFIS